MVSFLVVFEHPGPGHFPDLVQIPKQPGIEDFCAVGLVEAFDVRILVGLPGLNVVDLDTVVGSPSRKRLTEKFWAIVGAQHIGQATFGF